MLDLQAGGSEDAPIVWRNICRFVILRGSCLSGNRLCLVLEDQVDLIYVTGTETRALYALHAYRASFITLTGRVASAIYLFIKTLSQD